MIYSATSRQLLTLAVGILPAAMAQICTPNYGNNGYVYTVTTQSELDMITTECTTVNGSIIIGANFTGTFSLPNVRNITSQFWAEGRGISPSISTIASVDLPDLEFLGDLFLESRRIVTNFSAPKLKTARLVTMDHAQSVDLRSLEGAESLDIVGNITSLQLDSLKHVRQRCRICNIDTCNQMITPTTSFDLSLPSLETVGRANFVGGLLSLSVPKLSNIIGDGTSFSSLLLVTSGNTINISFPQLSSVNETIELKGSIGSLSMPKLKIIPKDFIVNSYVPLDINLPFQEAGYIDLSGNISSVQFPSLRSLPSGHITSDLNIDCDFIETTISKGTNTTDNVYCNSNSGPGLLVDVKAAVSVVIVVVGLLITL